MKNHLPEDYILKGKAHEYKIAKVLGQGTFGITYLATTKMKVEGGLGSFETNINVAIKEFFMKDINGREGTSVTSGSQSGVYSDYKRKFVREAQNLSKLHHPGIVKVLEVFEANNTVYYAMEYMGGGSLDNLISKKNHLSESETLKYTMQICNALSYMHSQKILHLDLKPGNIMLRDNGEAVLIDFGLSKQYDDNGNPESSTTIGGGTPGYAPMEQADYQEGKGFQATMDIYALGATMFKMLTGKRPPEASDILNDGFPAYKLQEKSVSEEMIGMVAKAMMPTRKMRYQSISEFISSLSTDTDNLKSDGISTISIFYYDESKQHIVAFDNGLMYYIKPDDNLFQVIGDNKIDIDISMLRSFRNKTNTVKYGSLYEIISKLNLRENILQSRCLVTYGDVNYITVLTYLIKIFDTIPSKARVIKKSSLAALYCAGCVRGIDNKNVHLEYENQDCVFLFGDGVVEINGFDKENESVNIVLSTDRFEVVAGAVIKFLILHGRIKDLLLLDTFAYDISCGIFADEQTVIIEADTTIPAKKSIDLEKGYADKLYITIAGKHFVYKMGDKLFSQNRIEVIVDICSRGIPIIKIKSEDTAYSETVTMKQLLVNKN